MTRDEWIAQFAPELSLDAPGPDTVDQLLRLAAIAAHASERTSAPVACYLAGLAGMDLDEAIALAEQIT